MKRRLIIGIVALVLLGGARSLFLWYVNTHETVVAMHVAGTVDEVLFYKITDGKTPISRIATGGTDIERSFAVPSATGFSLITQSAPAVYYFVATKGPERSQSRPIGLATSQDRVVLTIHDLYHYEVSP